MSGVSENRVNESDVNPCRVCSEFAVYLRDYMNSEDRR